MSLWPRRGLIEVPATTVEVARAAFPRGCMAMRLRDLLGELFEDEQFTELFAVRGRPALAPGRLALVSVMQFAEGLTDRQAADAVRSRLDWKYLLGLELRDAGFDDSVLSEFRARLAETGSAERLLFDAVLDRLREAGWAAPGGRQRTDSTHVLAAVRTLQRLELAGEAVRAALEAIAATEPDWLTGWVPVDWFARYGPRADAYRLPREESERLAVNLQFAEDGYRLLEQVHAPQTPSLLRQLSTVEALRRIWIQQFYRDQDGVHRRESKGSGRPPGAAAIVSPYDLDARFRVKRSMGWTGYSVQLSEASSDDLPHLITYVATAPATEADVDTTDRVHDALDKRGLLPDEHYADSAYVTAEKVLKAHDRGVELIGPVNQGNQWQSRTEDAFDTDAFTIDWDTLTATCPQGHPNTWSGTGLDRHGNPRVMFTFSMTDCTPCPERSRCTRAKTAARTVTLRPREQHELLRRLHIEQATEQWHRRYGHRAGVEGTISQAVRAFGLRRSRYRGLAKTAVQHVLTATAINLTRLDAWLTGTPLGHTRISHLAALAPARPG
ncbi:IS1182 family transposase [Streptomyces kebangsaanensis]|uniref:IS1182 family transposase n=1 Tax=Streptomyces kebangsaanensis TaxID=864058 RepID=A0ABW6L5L1_9ACTN|nr:IS1182 family transposase [Streptomyces kebangsaanensis]